MKEGQACFEASLQSSHSILASWSTSKLTGTHESSRMLQLAPLPRRPLVLLRRDASGRGPLRRNPASYSLGPSWVVYADLEDKRGPRLRVVQACSCRLAPVRYEISSISVRGELGTPRAFPALLQLVPLLSSRCVRNLNPKPQAQRKATPFYTHLVRTLARRLGRSHQPPTAIAGVQLCNSV